MLEGSSASIAEQPIRDRPICRRSEIQDWFARNEVKWFVLSTSISYGLLFAEISQKGVITMIANSCLLDVTKN